MRIIFTILLALGTGTIGFLAGGGLGLLGGGFAGTTVGTATGICIAIDAAAKKGILTVAQAEQLGTNIGKAKPELANVVKNTNISLDDSSQACKQLLKAVGQTAS